MLPWGWVYIAALIAETIIRVPYNQQRRQTPVAVDRVSSRERLLLGSLWFGMFALPIVYLATRWLAFADYSLPAWAGWLGVALILAAVGVFWRAHHDLGRHWSPTLQIMADHTLVQSGLYRVIRHPMYASQLLWALAQPLLLQNWLAGVLSALLYAPLFIIRIPQEEALMLEQFGDQYRAYMQRTGRIFPRLGRRS